MPHKKDYETTNVQCTGGGKTFKIVGNMSTAQVQTPEDTIKNQKETVQLYFDSLTDKYNRTQMKLIIPVHGVRHEIKITQCGGEL